jgi:hypothetical protein
VKLRVCAQTGSCPTSFPQRRKLYAVLADRTATGSENGPLAPAGQLRGVVRTAPALFAVGQYSKKESAGPLFAVPRALSRAPSAVTWVAGSVVP